MGVHCPAQQSSCLTGGKLDFQVANLLLATVTFKPCQEEVLKHQNFFIIMVSCVAKLKDQECHVSL